MTEIDFPNIISKFDALLKRGLCRGVGDPNGQMCIEAAICVAMGLPFGDDPICVSRAVRLYKICLNDSLLWESPKSRAEGLRAVGIGQIGSAGVVYDIEFAKRISEKTIRILIPTLFREVFPDNPKCLTAADKCEANGTVGEDVWLSIETLKTSVYVAAANTAYWASKAVEALDSIKNNAVEAATRAAYAARDAAQATPNNPEKYLLLGAKLCLEVLTELKSPGCEWL